MRIQTLITPVFLSALVTAACGGVTPDDTALETTSAETEHAEHADDALFADSTALHQAPWDSEVTPIRMCWTDAAFKDETYAVARQITEDAVAGSWDAVSWISVSWADGCDNGGIPVGITSDAPNADTSKMYLNFEFKSWSPSCQPTTGDMSDRNWVNCVQTIAMHEFGHVLGFDHEQNRNPDGIDCDFGHQDADVGNFSINGDLAVGLIDSDSILSYCPEGTWSGGLTAADIEGVQAIYGFDYHGTEDGREYAIREGDKFFDIKSDSLVRTGRFDRKFRIEKVDGSGKVHFGDRIQIFSGDKKLCSTLGVGTNFGTVNPQLKFQTRAYDEGACIWTAEHVRDNVGYNDVDTNDPVRLRLKAPKGQCGTDFCDIPYDGSLSVRFLGPL